MARRRRKKNPDLTTILLWGGGALAAYLGVTYAIGVAYQMGMARGAPPAPTPPAPGLGGLRFVNGQAFKTGGPWAGPSNPRLGSIQVARTHLFGRPTADRRFYMF